MKTTHPRHPLLIITLFILLLGSLEARILRPMDFQYYPGLEGQDAVLNAYPNGNPQDADKTIRVKVFPLEETGYNLLVKDYKSTDTIHLTIPNRGKERTDLYESLFPCPETHRLFGWQNGASGTPRGVP